MSNMCEILIFDLPKSCGHSVFDYASNADGIVAAISMGLLARLFSSIFCELRVLHNFCETLPCHDSVNSAADESTVVLLSPLWTPSMQLRH